MELKHIHVIAINKSHKLEYLTLPILRDITGMYVEYLGEKYVFPSAKIILNARDNTPTIILNSQPSEITISPNFTERFGGSFEYRDNFDYRVNGEGVK